MSPGYIGFIIGVFVGVALGIFIIGIFQMGREIKEVDDADL